MIQALIDLKNEILTSLQSVQGNNDFNDLLTALISDIDSMSDSRMNYTVILQRLFDRLNEGLVHLNDTRPSSPAYNVLAPTAMALADMAILIEIIRAQVYVMTASGINLDRLGADYDFNRFQATQALRRGYTWNTQMVLTDFPIGSRFMTRSSGFDPLIFTIDKTEDGNVIWRCEAFGVVGNTFYGDLSLSQPLAGVGRATIIDTVVPGQNLESDEEYRRRFLAFLRRKAFGGNVANYVEEIQKIDGVGNLIVFPVWRAEGTCRIFVLDPELKPISEEFRQYVQNIVDPITKSIS